MRNLQKILALVLALVMSLSLMATAGARDFTDGDQIDETFAESVDVLTGLEVFQGYPSGDFQPKGDITRAEVAAIIYRIATGDVTDSQVGIYADYNKFSDVPSDNWAAGYINYCANAEYIKGRGDGKFYPQDKVTGYEALAMILRVVGYDKNGEFTGADWQVQTAATANQRKVTKNVNAGTLGNPASRETVAELLCQAILIEKVNYTLAFGYQISTDPEDTIAYETFKMEKLTGVVTGNEIADLYADSPKPAGQTDLLVDGEELTLNVVSDLDDIGESCRVYVRPQSGTTRYDMVTADVYATEENNVYDSGDRVADITSSGFAATLAEQGINSLTGAEHFVNFDQATDYEARKHMRYEITLGYSEYEIQMLLNTNGGSATLNGVTVKKESLNAASTWDTRRTTSSNYVYTKTINAFAKLTDQDWSFIRTIFSEAENTGFYVTGEVYDGTKTNVANPEDISDQIRWEDFVNAYIKVEENRAQISGNGLGNRLKVIDNDNNGIADYVLQTVFTVAKVAPNGTSLDVNGMKFADSVNNDAVNNVSGDTLVSVTGINLEKSEDTLAAGDVVVYALIDGNIRAQKAENETSRVTSINRSTTPLTATISEEKKESAVHTHSEGLASGVTNMVIGTNYTSYFDLYGNLAAYTEGEVGKFVLITDGWFKQAVNAREYAVQAYVDGQLQNVDITNNGQLFIETNSTSNNNWNHLKALGGTTGVLNAANGGTFLKTTVACLDGGNLLPVEQSTYYRQRVAMLDMVDNAIPVNNGSAKGNAYITSANYNSASAYDTAKVVTNADGSTTAHTNVEVLGRSDTVYYTVYKTGINTVTGQPNYVVRSYTGYANVPNINRMYIEDVYAVGIEATRTNATNFTPYYTAEVVVIELNSKYQYQNDSEQVFIPGITVVNNDVSRTAGYGIETITMIRANGEVQDVQVDMSQSNVRWYNIAGNSAANRIFAGLYYMDPTDSNPNVYRIRPMTQDDIRANNYMAGYVTQSTAIVPTDYVRVDMQLFNGARDANGNLIAMNTPIDAASGNYNITATQEKSVSANSKLYTLGYSGNFVASLGKDKTAGEVFLQNPDRNTSDLDSLDPLNELWNGTNFSNNPRNEVLVRYDGNTVVWAISFREYRTGSVRDFAQTVWYDCLPAQTAQTPVTFWGVGDNDAANLDQNRTAGTIEISHSTAVANADKGIVDVNATAATVRNYTLYRRDKDTAGNFLNTWTPMTANQEDNAATNGNLSTAREEYRLVINPNNGAVQTEYYLIKLAAATEAKLTKGGNPIANNELDAIPANMEIESYLAQYEVSAGATAVWTFMTKGGVSFTATAKNNGSAAAALKYSFSDKYDSHKTDDINYVTVTVTAEQSGAANTYRSQNAPSATTNGTNVNGVPATIYGGEVLNLSAAGAGKIEVRKGGTLLTTLNLDANFQTTYTVPVGASGIFTFTFVPDTSVPSPNGVLKIGTGAAVVADVKIVNGTLTLPAGYVFPNTTGTVNVNFRIDKAVATNDYQVFIVNSSSSEQKNIDTIKHTNGTDTNVTLSIPVSVGNWDLNVAKVTAAQTAKIQFSVNNGKLSSYGDSAKLPDVSMTLGGKPIEIGIEDSFNAFEAKDLVITAPEGYTVNVTTSSTGWAVIGSGKTVSIRNKGASDSGVIEVALDSATSYNLVKITTTDTNVYYGDKALNNGNYYALPENAEIRVTAAAGKTVTDVGLMSADPVHQQEWNATNGAKINADRSVTVCVIAGKNGIVAEAATTQYWYNFWGQTHGCVVIGEGAIGRFGENVRPLTESELKNGTFTAKVGKTDVVAEKVEILDYAAAHPGDGNHPFAQDKAGFFKLHLTCTGDFASCSGATDMSVTANPDSFVFTFNGNTVGARNISISGTPGGSWSYPAAGTTP